MPVVGLGSCCWWFLRGVCLGLAVRGGRQSSGGVGRVGLCGGVQGGECGGMWRAVRNVVLVVAVYYLLPLDVQQGPWAVALRLLGVVAGIVFVAWGVWAAVVREAAGEADQGIRLDLLILVSVVGVVVFALADYLVATRGTGEFVELNTRTDALYFAVSTLATVGFGDVHAQGQIGRGLVLIQMVFNVVVLAAAFSLLRQVAGDRRRKRAQEE